ncbi:MAG: hydrogenase 4 subunit B [Burkholderiaceae bacterium]|nr:hydrogenase 4 subunit B [Burkholderiaceae bacterium]
MIDWVQHLLSLDVVLLAIGAWLSIGMVGLLALHRFALISKLLFPLGAAVSLVLCVASALALGQAAQVAVLPLGLPDLPFHLRLDSLSALFLMVLGGVGVGVSLFAAGYFRKGEGTPPGLLCFQYHLFLASMGLVLVADDAYAFMVMWETMALSSFFLVTSNHQIPEIRRAGYLYLLVAHIGALAILLCFGVLQAKSGDYTFANMRAQHPSTFWASVAFLLAVFGFGAKAGIVPLHIWLPEAHPAAPSPVSAMMSGVMLKTAIYGVLRVTFDLLSLQLWWWGALLLAIGLSTALFGVVFSAVQTDMKRLLAYSSIENIGLIFAAMGLGLLFHSYHMPALAALALIAGLYHVVAHAAFKSLLFVCTGSVLHATAERNLGHLGGLIRYMPWVAWLSLIGALTSAGLPPFGGFVSEWLLLQSFLFTPELPNGFLNMLVPVVAAVIALIAALAGYTMVKFFGVVFLGQPREGKLSRAHDAGPLKRAGMIWLAAICILLGLLPAQIMRTISPAIQLLTGFDLGSVVAANGSWVIAPISLERASYGPVVFLLGAAACCMLAFLLVRLFYHARLRRAPAWDCGYPWQSARMQDTAEGLGQPIRQIFETFFRMERELPSPFDDAPRYRMILEDHFWYWLYLPIARLVERISRLVGLLQQGRISLYLLYSFVTLVVLLVLVKQ